MIFKIYFLFFALTLMFNANGQDWKWINPTPSGNQLNAVKYIDSNTAIAVGNQGTILKSTNGGQDWEPQKSFSTTDLLSISIIDEDTIYASGRDLTVLKTTDGGTTWSKVKNGAYGNLYISFLFFSDSSTGYLLGDGMEVFFKTTDSGKSWFNVPVELNFQGVTSLYFTSPDTGFASIGHGWSEGVLKTTDGGYHWTTIPLPIRDQFNSLFFTDKQTGYMVGNSGSILKTENAGENWQVQNQFPSNLTNSNLLSVEFINKQVGFAVGWKDILKTADGGKKWELIAHSAFDLRSVSLSDSIHGICVGGDWLHEFSGIITTLNGGHEWKERALTVISSNINKIRFVNSELGYAVGGSTSTFGGFILKTIDSGQTWVQLNTGIEMYRINDLALPDENTIYVIGERGQLLKSVDAGESWLKQSSNTQKMLNAVSFLNSSSGYIVGENGTILKTTNGGNSWTNQESPTDKSLYSAFFKDEQTGYIVSYDWSIDSCTLLLTTTDGGLKWHKKSIGLLRYPMKITFVNNDTAFIAGNFGGILKTTDGGKNWISAYKTGNDYYDMFFTTENTGYVVGFDGEISMTENCGNDWTVLNSGTDKDLLSICFTDINTGFAVGTNGIIIKTTNSGSSLKTLMQPPPDICVGDSVMLKPNFIGGTKPLSYKWNNLETNHEIFVSPEKSTIYNVTIVDQESDSIQIEIPVYVNSVQTPEISLRSDTLYSNMDYGNQWYRNDTLLTDIYSNILVPELSGNYYSIIYDYNCYSGKSNVINYWRTNLNDKTFDDEILIYPNPAATQITLSLPQNYSQGELKLVDVNTKEILKLIFNKPQVNINISNLADGIYFMQISCNNQMIIKKIVKK